MAGVPNAQAGSKSSRRTLALAVLALIVLFGAYLRFHGLGTRSLWLDEFATWHVSQMPLGESLGWQPELTKPPLYQLSLRCLTDDPHPSEWQLRLPAALCGVLAIAAAAWLGRLAGGWVTACALAALVACNPFQIEYSQEARAYSMMVLGCTLSIALWYRLVMTLRPRYFYGYIVATAVTFHAHYLTLLAVLAQVVWWIIVQIRQPRAKRSLRPLYALIITGMLCVPMVAHYLYCRSSVFQGLGWIKPPTWGSALDVLGQLTFGRLWVFAILVPALVLWLAGSRGWQPARLPRPGGRLSGGAADVCALLIAWLACAGFGLLVISWLTHPAMVARYAIPSAVPALLIPLLVAYRLDRRLPLIIMIVFLVRAAPEWVYQASEYEPGFRELTEFLHERVDPATEGVVLTIDNRTYPNWEDMERLVFDYYPLNDIPVKELHLAPDGVTPKNRILEEDTRALWLVVLWADPFAILEKAGREARPIWYEGESYSRLIFRPYRLVSVAPVETE
jgi:hypothetical protein